MKKEELVGVLTEGVYTKPETIRAIMVDFLTLKAALVAKGIVTEEELVELRPEVEKQVDQEVWQKVVGLLNQNNAGVNLFMDLLAGVFRKKGEENATDSTNAGNDSQAR